jgi:hypothetical protein
MSVRHISLRLDRSCSFANGVIMQVSESSLGIKLDDHDCGRRRNGRLRLDRSFVHGL